MPYIDCKFRDEVYPSGMREASNAGELNYQITMLLQTYVGRHGTNSRT